MMAVYNYAVPSDNVFPLYVTSVVSAWFGTESLRALAEVMPEIHTIYMLTMVLVTVMLPRYMRGTCTRIMHVVLYCSWGSDA